MVALRSTGKIAIALALAGCGTRTGLPVGGAFADAGTGDAADDAAHDAAHDAPHDAPHEPDAAPDAPGIKPGLGEACDGAPGNPSSCAVGLACYDGTNNPNQEGRWPGGFCTVECSSGVTCKPWGGVCAGAEFGTGRCVPSCTTPKDCRKGYACRNVSLQGQELACAPTGFIATRGPGEACFQHADPGAPHYAPDLPQVHFGAAQQADLGFFGADEIALAVDDTDRIVVGANAISQQGYDNPAFYGSVASQPIAFSYASGPSYSPAAYYSDPSIVAGADGSFYYSTLGLDYQAQNAWLVVARSGDGGADWVSTHVNPASDCAGTLGTGVDSGPCMDHPWLAIGPDRLAPGKQALYAAYLATRANSDYTAVVIRSTDSGKTWGIPGSPGNSLSVFSTNENGLFINLITPSVADDGTLHMVAVGVADEPHGSAANAVYYSRSDDGGKTRTPPIAISQPGVPVPFEQPVIATDGPEIYVAYAAGTPDGAWDIVLAHSSDGATWSYQVVNDDPEKCATHFHPAIAVDPSTHQVYVAWYDGRFAPYEGDIALTACDGTTPGVLACSPNEAIDDTPFFISTDRVELFFIGDYFTLVARPGGELWAGFGDTRQNGLSHAFVARGLMP